MTVTFPGGELSSKVDLFAGRRFFPCRGVGIRDVCSLEVGRRTCPKSGDPSDSMKSIFAPFAFVKKIFHRILREDRVRILSFYWSIAIIFLSFAILSSSNPFRLLVPGLAWQMPGHDWRSKVKLYGVDRNTGVLIPTTRLILKDKEPHILIRRIAEAVGSVPSLAERKYLDHSSGTEVLPSLGLAIKRGWVLEQNGKKRILVDLRKETLENEMAFFLRERSASEEKRQHYMDGFFKALTYSILSILDDYESVEYTIDGTPHSTFPGMTFDLSKTYTHADLP